MFLDDGYSIIVQLMIASLTFPVVIFFIIVSLERFLSIRSNFRLALEWLLMAAAFCMSSSRMTGSPEAIPIF